MAELDMSWQAGPGVSMFAPDLFEGKVAVITGGGSGLGREVAHGLRAPGRPPGHRRPDGRQARRRGAVRSRRIGGECTAIPTNIRDTDQVDALRDEVYERFGRADFLVNNAGGQFPGLPSSISDNGWRAVVDLNLNGTWNVTNRFMVPMAEAGFGAIVNVVHLFSFDRGAPMFVHSGAARAGVVNMVKTLAPYLMRKGVTINVLAPGSSPPPPSSRPSSSRSGTPRRASPRSCWRRACRPASGPSTRWPPPSCSSAPPLPATSAAPPSSPTAPRCRATGSRRSSRDSATCDVRAALHGGGRSPDEDGHRDAHAGERRRRQPEAPPRRR